MADRPLADFAPAAAAVLPLLSRRDTGGGHVIVRFANPWGAIDPGRFVMAQPVTPGVRARDPLLKRPYSVMDADADGFDLLVKVVGRGTALLAAARPGDPFEVVGPLGRPFAPPPPGRPVWMVGGGIGIAPFVALSRALRARDPAADLTAFIGGRGAADIQCRDELAALGVRTVIATETGEAGVRGRITVALDAALAERAPGVTPAVFTCGPNAMMAAVAERGLGAGLDVQVSLEAYMACGFGICVGCAHPTADGGYLRVCREGPCVDARVLAW